MIRERESGLGRRWLRPLAALALSLSAGPALACSVCAAGDPLVAAGDASPEGRELHLALETEWLTASAGMAEMPGATEELEQWTLRAAGAFSPAHRVNVAIVLPLVRKGVRMSGAGMAHADGTFSGLGDAEIGARWFLLDRTDFAVMRHQTVALSAGTSLPTGENAAREGGVRVDEHSQLGTGGWGPYAGALYRLEQSRWHAFASVAGRLRSENRFGYRYGPALAWTVQAQVQINPRLAAGLGLDGREAWPDELRGAAVAHTGGLVLTASPELHVGLGGSLWLGLRAQLPVATRLRGDQEVGPTVTAGLRIRAL